jgi:hypothetical protein
MLMVLSEVEGPFDKPFDRLIALSEIEGSLDILLVDYIITSNIQYLKVWQVSRVE